jgi:hypothetical protein
VVLLPLLVADCGGSAPDAALPTDETLQRETNAGRLAFELERDEEAVARFRAALARAQERDDPDAISNTGFDLAVAELRANAPHQALADARATRMELERRGAKPFPALQLAEGTALYRIGELADADRLAQLVQHSDDAEAAARATFLRGRIADDRGDVSGLATAAGALNATDTASFAADSAELSARLALRRGDAAGGSKRRRAQRNCVRRRSIIEGSHALWRSRGRRPNVEATRPPPRTSFSGPVAAPPCRATRVTPAYGSAARYLSALASRLGAPPPICYVSSMSIRLNEQVLATAPGSILVHRIWNAVPHAIRSGWTVVQGLRPARAVAIIPAVEGRPWNTEFHQGVAYPQWGLLDQPDDLQLFGGAGSPYAVLPSPDRAFFQQSVLGRELSHHFLQRAASRRSALTSSEVAARAVSPARRFLPAFKKFL